MASAIPLVVIIGPTASGKSDLAIDLACELGRGAEIVNGDSMLVYRGMDIGTAKPTMEERRGVPHHLVDVLDVTRRASVADFQADARRLIADIRSRGKVPILVGGSSLYVRAAVDVFDFPGTDPTIRAKWERRLAEIGPEALHAELAAVAPEAAARMEPLNGRRTVRALEVYEITGEFSGALPEPTYELENVHQFGLSVERALMDERIALRVDRMWERGLVDEVRDLAEHHNLRDGVTARRALGYAEVLQLLDGELTEDEAKKAIVDHTKRFARKQLGWFRRDPRIQWLTAGDPDNVAAIAASIGEPLLQKMRTETMNEEGGQ